MRHLAFLGVIACVAQFAYSQQSQAPMRRPSSRQTPPVAVAAPAVVPSSGIGAPLSPEVDRLPPNYPGDSIEEVAKLLAVAPKSEFETTEQYNARLAGSRSERTYSFWLDRPMDRFYDADKQELRVSLSDTNCTYVNFSVNCNRPALIVKMFESDRSTYTASNAYGAKREVLKKSTKYYGVFIGTPPLQFNFLLPMPVETAKVLKESVSILITVGPVTGFGQPLVVEGYSGSNPTFNAPLDTFDHYTYLALPLIRTWIASRTTGQILQKFDVSQ